MMRVSLIATTLVLGWTLWPSLGVSAATTDPALSCKNSQDSCSSSVAKTSCKKATDCEDPVAASVPRKASVTRRIAPGVLAIESLASRTRSALAPSSTVTLRGGTQDNSEALHRRIAELEAQNAELMEQLQRRQAPKGLALDPRSPMGHEQELDVLRQELSNASVELRVRANGLRAQQQARQAEIQQQQHNLHRELINAAHQELAQSEQQVNRLQRELAQIDGQKEAFETEEQWEAHSENLERSLEEASRMLEQATVNIDREAAQAMEQWARSQEQEQRNIEAQIVDMERALAQKEREYARAVESLQHRHEAEAEQAMRAWEAAMEAREHEHEEFNHWFEDHHETLQRTLEITMEECERSSEDLEERLESVWESMDESLEATFENHAEHLEHLEERLEDAFEEIEVHFQNQGDWNFEFEMGDGWHLKGSECEGEAPHEAKLFPDGTIEWVQQPKGAVNVFRLGDGGQIFEISGQASGKKQGCQQPCAPALPEPPCAPKTVTVPSLPAAPGQASNVHILGTDGVVYRAGSGAPLPPGSVQIYTAGGHVELQIMGSGACDSSCSKPSDCEGSKKSDCCSSPCEESDSCESSEACKERCSEPCSETCSEPCEETEACEPEPCEGPDTFEDALPEEEPALDPFGQATTPHENYVASLGRQANTQRATPFRVDPLLISGQDDDAQAVRRELQLLLREMNAEVEALRRDIRAIRSALQEVESVESQPLRPSRRAR